MDVFEVREQLVRDYRSFTAASVDPRDHRIRAFIRQQLEEGAQWPDPWLSLNPNFAAGGTVTQLIDEGLLHQECEQAFRVKEHANDAGRRTITLHRHQSDAVRAAASGKSYVLTTGTGSGKSLGYIVPIVDRVLRERTAGGRSPGVKAIEAMLPLYEAKMVHHFDHRWATYGPKARPATSPRPSTTTPTSSSSRGTGWPPRRSTQHWTTAGRPPGWLASATSRIQPMSAR